MPLDYQSLLTAFALSGCGLAITFLVSWLVSRTEGFLIVWTFGVSFMALGVLTYAWYTANMSPLIGAAGYIILLTGLACVYGAGREFRTGTLPWRSMAIMAALSSVAMAVPMLAGYNAIAIIVLNVAAAIILMVTAWDYWLGRAEARLTITLLTVLYAVTGLSFVPCAVLLLRAGEWRLTQAPSNWAEDLNIVVCLTTLAGIGALSLALNQVRLARGHKRDAETDPLTGLLNRRALLRRVEHDIQGPAALIVFDLDHFKTVNDIHGHPAGDDVLRSFAEILKLSCRQQGFAARLGGEEFALLMPGASLASAALLADTVRARLAKRRFIGNGGPFNSTVSAGISCSEDTAVDFEALLHDADAALYAAKRDGRNRVVASPEETESAAHMHSRSTDPTRLKTG